MTVLEYCRTLSTEQLLRFHRQVMDRVYRAFDGGLMFGFDWRTLHICSPGLAGILGVIAAEETYRTRPPASLSDPYPTPFGEPKR